MANPEKKLVTQFTVLVRRASLEAESTQVIIYLFIFLIALVKTEVTWTKLFARWNRSVDHTVKHFSCFHTKCIPFPHFFKIHQLCSHSYFTTCKTLEICNNIFQMLTHCFLANLLRADLQLKTVLKRGLFRLMSSVCSLLLVGGLNLRCDTQLLIRYTLHRFPSICDAIIQTKVCVQFLFF